MFTINDVKHTFETTGSRTRVEDDPMARVMYYLSCVKSVIDVGMPPWVTDYKNYEMYQGWGDVAQVVQFAEFYDPEVLIKAGCFINNATMCGDSLNEFMHVTQKIRSEFNVCDGCTFGNSSGQRKLLKQTRIRKVMFYKKRWLEETYYDALSELKSMLRFPRIQPTFCLFPFGFLC